MAELIYVDESGKEIRREAKGRGRNPAGATKDKDGNWIVPPAVEKAEVFYIDLNEKGKEVKREKKGRGRTKPDYELMTEGDHAGHWVRSEGAPVTA